MQDIIYTGTFHYVPTIVLNNWRWVLTNKLIVAGRSSAGNTLKKFDFKTRLVYGTDCFIIPFGLVETFKEEDISKFVRVLYNLRGSTHFTLHSFHSTYSCIIPAGRSLTTMRVVTCLLSVRPIVSHPPSAFTCFSHYSFLQTKCTSDNALLQNVLQNCLQHLPRTD